MEESHDELEGSDNHTALCLVVVVVVTGDPHTPVPSLVPNFERRYIQVQGRGGTSTNGFGRF